MAGLGATVMAMAIGAGPAALVRISSEVSNGIGTTRDPKGPRRLTAAVPADAGT